MKKSFITTALLIVAFSVSAQSLEEIVKKYSDAIHSDKLSSVNTIKISGKMATMGMEMPMTMFMKNPNKIKVIYTFNGQDIITVFDGEKGYTINPLMGSSDPVELNEDQMKQIQNNNAFRNEVMNYFSSGRLSLEGEENVKGRSAYKLKAAVEESNPVYMYLDKETGLLIKTSTSVDQMGSAINVDSYMTDYAIAGDVVLPKKTTTTANGMEAAVISFDDIEVNTTMEDEIFRIK